MLQKYKKIKGINLGGWLLMEGYILGGINIAESSFKNKFYKLYGKKALGEFEDSFRNNFIEESDFKKISSLGANAIRLPFNCRLLEEKPYRYSERGFSYLKKTFTWAKKYNLGIILDLHAAAGSQNNDWHSDSQGKALLWSNREYQKRSISLWVAIADRFKGEPSLIGYDLLNEPVLDKYSTAILKEFYKCLIKNIKSVDKKHLIFLEGDIWAQRIDFLEELISDNISISIHTYQPLDFTFNFSPFYRFPGKINNVLWDKQRIYKYFKPYYKFSEKNKVKIFVGEFGINWRGGFWGESKWLEAVLQAFEEFKFNYTYWTYKAVANNAFPDGLYQHIRNSKYINRGGFPYGWDTYLKSWNKDRKSLVNFWRTKNFVPNEKLIGILQKYFKK